VGTLLIPALIDAGFTVSVLVRPSSTATFPPTVTVHRADYDDYDALVSAFRHQDAVISAVGTFNASIQRTAVDAAVAAKVKRFLPSEYGGDTARPEFVSFADFPVEKRKIVTHLQSKEGLGLSWTAICTGSFFNWVCAKQSVLGAAWNPLC
jgi:uncharacterized protein YbjT (DUF2867 family)